VLLSLLRPRDVLALDIKCQARTSEDAVHAAAAAHHRAVAARRKDPGEGAIDDAELVGQREPPVPVHHVQWQPEQDLEQRSINAR